MAVRLQTIKCREWRYYAETVKRTHEAHEWFDPQRGFRKCPGITFPQEA